jgi:HPt (histidine-containing phosphotransfer) domain-containing protein
MADAGAAEAVEGIVQSFVENLALRLTEMGAAVAAGNAAEVARLAHAFKSSAAQLGATKLAGLLKEIEGEAKGGNDLNEAFDQVRREAEAVRKYLTKSEQ